MPLQSLWLRGIATFVALATIAALAPRAATAQADDQTIQIRGRVSSFDGAYSLVVRDEQGYLDTIALHDGTIINPSGLTLAPGMVVSVVGYNDGATIGANEIDTPYVVYGGTPYFQGQPWTAYAAGAALGIFFASTLWWHGDDFSGGYHYHDGRRYWAHVNRARLYRGGYFRGHAYYADARHGGWAGHGDPRVVGHFDRRGPDAHRFDEHRGLEDRRGIEEHRAIAENHHAVDVHGRPITASREGGFGAHGYAGAGVSHGVDVHGRPITTAREGGTPGTHGYGATHSTTSGAGRLPAGHTAVTAVHAPATAAKPAVKKP